MKTIFIGIFSPNQVRNFLLIPDGVFGLLKKAGLKIVLLVPSTACEQIKKDFVGENIFVESIIVDWKRNFLQNLYYFISSYLNFTEGARLFAWMGVRIDVPVADKKRWFYPLKVFIAETIGKSRWIRMSLMLRLDNLVYYKRPHKEIFDKYNPNLVFVPDVLSAPGASLVREAKRQNIKTIGMPASWDHLPKRFEPLHVDNLLVWNELLKKEAINLQNYHENNTFVIGVPQYDAFAQKNLLWSREEFMKKFNFDQSKKTIFFSSSSVYAPDDGDIAEILINAIKEKKFSCPAQLFIRPYPGITIDHEKFDRFDSQESVYIDWIEQKKIFGHSGFAWYPTFDSMIHFANLLYHCDIIISTYSSVSVEASAFSKPIININFDGFKNRPFNQSVKRFKHLSHFKHVLETNGVRQAENEEDLLRAINEFLKNPDVNKENVVKLRDKMCWKIDGKSSERIANHLLGCLK